MLNLHPVITITDVDVLTDGEAVTKVLETDPEEFSRDFSTKTYDYAANFVQFFAHFEQRLKRRASMPKEEKAKQYTRAASNLITVYSVTKMPAYNFMVSSLEERIGLISLALHYSAENNRAQEELSKTSAKMEKTKRALKRASEALK